MKGKGVGFSVFIWINKYVKKDCSLFSYVSQVG